MAEAASTADEVMAEAASMEDKVVIILALAKRRAGSRSTNAAIWWARVLFLC